MSMAEALLESAQIVREQADAMTIPTEDVHPDSDWLFSFVDELRELPHVKDLTEITALWNSLNEQKKQKLWPVQEDLSLQSLQNALLNSRRLAEKWKKSRVRLLFEPLTLVEDLSNTFIDIRKHFDQLQVSSKDQIVDQLDKVIKDLNDGGACNELKSAKAKFEKLFFQYIHEKRSKLDTSEDSNSVSTWLGGRLGTDAGSIKQELEEVKENEGSFLEVLLYITELEEDRKCSSDGRASIDANPEERIFDKPVDEVSHNAVQAVVFDKPLNEVARDAVQALGLKRIHWVLMGFEDLTRCTKMSKGKLEVFKANAIPEAIRLAQTEEGLYTYDAMTLLEALTSSNGAGEDYVRSSENREIYYHISDHLDFLINLMKTHRDLRTRLLAAETVVNMLVNFQVWKTVRIQYDIVSALVAIANEDMVDQSIHDRDRADLVCLEGLSHLKEFSTRRKKLEIKSANDKTQIIVTAMMKLLRDGLKETVLRNLAKDTLVALDTQVLVTDHRTPTREIWLEVQAELLNLMVTDDLISHTTIPGRMAIMSLMRKLCDLYKEGITEGLVLYLLNMMETTGREIMQLPNSEENVQKVNDLKQILDLAVKLFCLCVTRGKDKAQAVLTQNVAERKTLEVMLEEQNSGILDESKLEILEIFDKIDMPSSSQGPTSVGELAVLVKMAKSQSPGCRAQVASRLLKFVKEKLDETVMEEAGGIAALMDLLNEKEVDCQKDALLALYLLSPKIAIQTKDLPLKIILGFLHPKWPSDLRDAAVGFLDLMVKESAANAKKFMETPAALKAILLCLDKDAENLSCQKSVSALLRMATEEDDVVRFGIAGAGLSTLVKFVLRLGTIEHKKLLTVMLGQLCKSGADCEEAVTRANGHAYLLMSLQEKISMDAAAQGLLSLLNHARTRGDVLQAGFVEIAMGSIDRENASAEMALGLASVCNTPDGLDQIVACSNSVGALLILLERCPTFDGKGAAAAVIAKMYPRLNSNDDLRRQVPEMTDACSHLIKYLDHRDRSQHQEFLKALAAFATVKKGRQTIHEERGQMPLMRFLKDKEIDAQVRDLVLQILAEMSSVFADGVTTRDFSYHKILNVFLEFRIGVLLCELFKSEEFRKNTESMKNMLILIRNLSLAGTSACNHLSDAGAVNLLLNVLSDHGSSLSTVTELAVKALVKFMDDPEGKKEFLNGGIRSLVSILKLDAGTSDARNLTAIIPIILASVAQDPRTGGAACTAIYKCDILQALNTIIYDGETSRIKWQAAVLIKLLATNGPTKQVCASIYNAGTLDALIDLRTVKHCEDIANDVLKFLKGKNIDCKKHIDDRLKKSR